MAGHVTGAGAQVKPRDDGNAHHRTTAGSVRAMLTYRYVLAGIGNVGRRFLELVAHRKETLRDVYGIELVCAAAADSGGVALEPDVELLVKRKAAGQKLEGGGSLEDVEADFYLDATPNDARDPSAGIARVRRALLAGKDTVLASKAPLVHGFDELAALSDLTDPGKPALRFSGAVCGALPTVNVGRRDLACGFIRRLDGVLNLTSQIVLRAMGRGQSYADAVAAAQAEGVAEPDPTLDVDGWDSAYKLVILGNAVLRDRVTLAQVDVRGIREAKKGALVASAVHDGARYHYTVGPAELPAEHPLARLGAHEMGLTYESDIHGAITLISSGQGPMGAAAAMLRDVLEIAEI
jgi:homoserine dehydrogenase